MYQEILKSSESWFRKSPRLNHQKKSLKSLNPGSLTVQTLYKRNHLSALLIRQVQLIGSQGLVLNFIP